MKRKFLCLFCLLAPLLFFPHAVQAEESTATLQTLSQEIHERLDDLKRQSQHLTEQLLIAENELQMSSKQVETLQTELSELNTCLNNTNQKLSEYSAKLTEYETKLKFWRKIRAIAAIVLLLAIAVRAVLLFLKIKFGITIPYILNLLK